MFGVVMINEKEVPLKASGATPFYFNNVFKIDLLTSFTKLSDDEIGKSADLVSMLAYIMNAQAEKKDMSALNKETFYEWLDQFGANDLPEAGDKIIDVYSGNLQTSSNPKKKNNQ